MSFFEPFKIFSKLSTIRSSDFNDFQQFVKEAFDRLGDKRTDGKLGVEEEFNVGAPVSPSAAVRKQDLDNEVGSSSLIRDETLQYRNAAQSFSLSSEAASVTSAQNAAAAASHAVSLSNPNSISTRSGFDSVAEANRRKFAGSGFVEWGKNLVQSGYTAVNEGLFFNPALANEFFMGAGDVNAAGLSLTEIPVVNVDGVSIELYRIKSSSTALPNRPILPPAPDGLDKADGADRFTDLAAAIIAGGTSLNASVINRQDLVGLEVWHEAITTNDAVFPLGNVQYGASTWEGVPLSNTVVAQTYSAFGEWDTSAQGYGVQWSTLSDAFKAKFLNDSKNNIYRDAETGEYVQVRYRIRSIAGLGEKWSFQTSGMYANADSSFRVQAQGHTTTVPALGGYSGATTLLSGTDRFPDGEGAAASNGIYTTLETASLAYGGKCYFLPIALVSRRNQGAYHPVLNPNGTAGFWRKDQISDFDWWYEDQALEPRYTSDCFDSGAFNSGAFTSVGAGAINDVVRRPDAKPYDAIYEGDVKDLRINARRKAKSDLREEFKRKAIANEVRGVEDQSIWEVASVAEELGATASGTDDASTDGASFAIGEFVLWANGDNVGYGYVRQTDSNDVRISKTRPEAFANITNPVFNRTQGATTTIYRLKENLNFKELLQCDVIGDPENYFSGQDYTNTGASQTVDVVQGTVVKITDPTPVGSTQTGHFYRRTSASPTTVDLSVFDYELSTNWSDLGTTYDGQTWTNDGTSQTVTVNTGDVVFISDPTPVGGTQTGEYYRRSGGVDTLDLSTFDYSVLSGNWENLGRKYRGQQWTNDGTNQVVDIKAGDVIYNNGSSGSGTIGHFYTRGSDALGADLSAQFYDNYLDLGPDWNESAAAGSWLQDGIPGFPLLTHSDTGASLIPDGTSKYYKHSRKAKDAVLFMYSLDNGVTWVVDNSFLPLIEATSNGPTSALANGAIFLSFYLTDAHFTQEANNSVVDALGDVFSVDDHRPERGNNLLSSMIRKVGTDTGGVTYSESKLKTGTIAGGANTLVVNASFYPTHHGITLDNPNGSPAVKVLSYLSHENGRYYLNLLAVELGWDTTKGDFADATSKTSNVASNYNSYELYRIWFPDDSSLIVQAVNSGAGELFSQTYQVGDVFYKSSGSPFFRLWDGTGWGDDKEFTVLDGTDVKTDLNGNTRLVTQHRFELPYLTGEDN